MQPSVSVVLPVFNGARFLRAAISSVIEQTVPPAEVIVIDDGSVDGSAEIASRFGPPVSVLVLPHFGGASALNAGVRQAAGHRLAFIDADDLWAPDKLSRQIAALDAQADLEAVFGHVGEFLDEDCRIQDPVQANQLMRTRAGISKTTMVILRTAFERVGAFDPSFTADFPEWYARALGTKLRFALLDDVVAFRRIHSANTSRSLRVALHADYLRMARARVHHVKS